MKNFFPWVIGLTTVIWAHAADQATSARTKAQATTKVKYETTEFDTNLTKLPPNFQGHSLDALLRSIKPPAAKGEFEKTSDYEARVLEMATKPVLGTLTLGDAIALRMDQRDDMRHIPGWIRAKYNADLEEMTVILENNGARNIFAPGRKYDIRWLTATDHGRAKGAYRASNAFGATTTVDIFESTQTGLALVNGQELNYSYPMNTIRFTFSLPPDRAKSALKSTMALLILKPEAPFVVDDQYSISPTLESAGYATPDRTVRRRGLVASVQEVWISDGVTGEIFLKLKPTLKTIRAVLPTFDAQMRASTSFQNVGASTPFDGKRYSCRFDVNLDFLGLGAIELNTSLELRQIGNPNVKRYLMAGNYTHENQIFKILVKGKVLRTGNDAADRLALKKQLQKGDVLEERIYRQAADSTSPIYMRAVSRIIEGQPQSVSSDLNVCDEQSDIEL